MILKSWWQREIAYFKPEEFAPVWDWPDLTREQAQSLVYQYLDASLVLELDALRGFLDKPIIVLAGIAEKGHSRSSYHYAGRGGSAADVICPSSSLLSFFLAAQRFKFSGIGVYPDSWEFKKLPVKGLHLDTRPWPRGKPKAYWVRWGEFTYDALNAHTLMLASSKVYTKEGI